MKIISFRLVIIITRILIWLRNNSRTMDLICSHLSRVKENCDQDEVQKDFYQYISKTLSLKRAPFEYAKDWTIARKNCKIYNFWDIT